MEKLRLDLGIFRRLIHLAKVFVMKKVKLLVCFAAYMAFSGPEFLRVSRQAAIQFSLMPYALAGIIPTVIAFLCGLFLALDRGQTERWIRYVGAVLLVIVLLFMLRWSGIISGELPQALRAIEIHFPGYGVHILAFLSGCSLAGSCHKKV